MLEELTFWKNTQCEHYARHMFGFDLHYKHTTASGRKAMISLDIVVKSRDIPFLTKFRLVKAPVFPGVMYRCESWTIKKAEH